MFSDESSAQQYHMKGRSLLIYWDVTQPEIKEFSSIYYFYFIVKPLMIIFVFSNQHISIPVDWFIGLYVVDGMLGFEHILKFEIMLSNGGDW